MDSAGKSLSARSITLSRGESVIHVAQDRVINLAYGRYTLKVEEPGFASLTMPVVIDQPAQILAVAMKLARMENVDPPPCSISSARDESL
jgi:hypothetical protein